MTTRPDRSEAAEYYFKYIDKVPAGDICQFLELQAEQTLSVLHGISEERSRFRYASDKWSIKEVVGHVNDCERLFAGRAFWFARGFDSPLPSFDQNVAMTASAADERSWASHVEEFASVRAASVSFFRGLQPDAWNRRGIASDNPFSVRALAYLVAGHVTHHMNLVQDKYQLQR